jgi:hypothetical protein
MCRKYTNHQPLLNKEGFSQGLFVFEQSDRDESLISENFEIRKSFSKFNMGGFTQSIKHVAICIRWECAHFVQALGND